MTLEARDFSLVEATIATAIVASALAGLAQLMVAAAAANSSSKAGTIATMLAQDKLEALIAAADPYGGADFVDARGRVLAEVPPPPRATAFVRRWSVDSLSEGPPGVALLQVWVVRAADQTEAARVVGAKTQTIP
jgi:type II secretory pathway pseudopilin PulG